MRKTISTIVVSNLMFRTPSLQLHKPQINQVCSLLSVFSLFTSKHHLFTALSEVPKPPTPSSSTHRTNDTCIDLSSINTSGIAKSVLLRCSHLGDKKVDTFANPSLRELLFELSDLSPEITRRFRRVSELKPEDVLEILLGFQFYSGEIENEAKKIESLWGIFKWASGQSRDFKHLPRSCQVMATMLVRGGLFEEVEFLLSTMDSKGIPMDNNEIFSNLVEGYVGAGDLKRAMSIHDRMRRQGLVPSGSCYRVILAFLVQMKETQLVFRVYMDMVEMGLGMSGAEMDSFENVIDLLCRDGKVREARNLVKKLTAFGMEPSNLVLDAIASKYCEKKDYDDLLNLFFEIKCAPGVVVGNKIIFSLCRNFSIERANLFIEELECLGFIPDEITFGILIGWSCREGKLKNAFFYLSEVLSRGLKPDVHSYNALISGMFKESMWKHAQDILCEMDDQGVTPNMATFRVLLAGYCKARQFDEVKMVVCKMVDHGLIQISSLEDPISKAFTILGLNPLAVKVRRDNDVGFSKTEFFDALGNGLYLETDLEEYDKTMSDVLEDSVVPDFNSLVMKHCSDGKLKTALLMVDEMVRWGQELSLSVFSTLVKGLCASCRCIKAITVLLDKMPKLTNQLDQEALNLLVQSLSTRGLINKARIIFYGIVQRHLEIRDETYTAMITGLCKKGSLREHLDCWELARQDKWLPALKNWKAIMDCLCQQEMLKETMELFEIVMAAYPNLRLDICHAFLERLCGTGFTSTAHVLVEELLTQGFVLDHMAYSHLIRGFYTEKKFSKALMVFDIMLAKNLTPSMDVAVLLIPHLCRAGNFEKAVTLKEIGLREQYSDSLSVHCALINGFSKTGKVEEAVNLFQDMLLKGLLPGTEFYNMLVQGFCQARNSRRVGELLGIMVRKNLSISILSYRNLVRFMCMEGRVPFALSMKELMLKESNPPYLTIYNILIFRLFSTGNILIVDTLLHELQEKGLQLDTVTYNFLVYGYSRCKAVSRSLQYLNAAMLKDLRPSNCSLRKVISCLCCEGELGKALDLSREMESRGWIHDSIIQNAIAEGLLAQGMEDKIRLLSF
ncbi:pentatricopeptide repeat-containing protein At5g15280, mitochondrial isoform X2 [Cornus florida]|uniref:pentatricopeptide repeat-containing protein At5g15280, mitochondrial isoform X2 n=1 Tax=Cornus florida TaxID=4283 RepID=UPI002897978F|nr:pentatricopeptide repeat-containing protein At5g15280, mitochondrial isoform X2 [Cornus florida]